MAPKLRNQWLPISGMVAPKVRTGGVKRSGIITFYCRIFHVDGGYAYTGSAYHKNKRTDEITKLIYKADKESESLILQDVTGDEKSLQYLRQELDKHGVDGELHYINFPVWGKYKIYEKDTAQKEELVESRVILDKNDFNLHLGDKKQKRRFKIEVKKDTFYKIEIQLTEDFDFSSVEDLIVDFQINKDAAHKLRANAFLAKGRYRYTFYFNTEMLEQETGAITARIILKKKTGRAKQEQVKAFRITEMKKDGDS